MNIVMDLGFVGEFGREIYDKRYDILILVKFGCLSLETSKYLQKLCKFWIVSIFIAMNY